MDLTREAKVREFLLGLSDPASDAQIEDEILNGTILADQVRLIEDELIDDYLFGCMPPDEEKAFSTYFLCSVDRKQRLSFARGMIRQATNQGRISTDANRDTPHRGFWQQQLSLRWIAMSALACSTLVGILLAFQVVRSRDLIRSVRSAQLEAVRLRTALHTQESSRKITQPAESMLQLDLDPGLTRGIQGLPVLHRSPGNEFIWIRLHFRYSPRRRYREELISDKGESLWMQQSQLPSNDVATKSDLFIPTSLLSHGDYLIRLEEASAGGRFEEVASYPFRVAAN